MPRIQLPQAQQPAELQRSGYRVPVDQIIQVAGQNPLASGIDTVSTVLAKAIQRRQELRQQAQTVQALAQAAGDTAPTAPGISPDIYEKLLTIKTNRQKAQDDAIAKRADDARKKVLLEFELEKLRSGYEEHDPISGKTRIWSGVQGLSVAYDENGIPSTSRSEDYAPALKPKGGGSGGAASTQMEKEMAALEKRMSVNEATSRVVFGKSADVMRRTNNAIQLIDAHGGSITNAEANAISTDIAGILAGSTGSGVGEHMSKMHGYKTAYGDFQGLRQYLTGAPQAAAPAAIVSRLRKNLSDFNKVADQSIKETQAGMLYKNQHLKAYFPERYGYLGEAAGIDPTEIQRGKYVPKAGSESAGGQVAPVTDPAALAYLQKLGAGKK